MTNFQEDYVSFDTALKLKEKGFPQDISYCYDMSGKMHYTLLLNRHRQEYGESSQYLYVACPTLAMAAKWLRYVKGYHIEPNRRWDWNNNTEHYVNPHYELDYFKDGEVAYGTLSEPLPEGHWHEPDSKKFDTYEQALEAGIDYILDKYL